MRYLPKCDSHTPNEIIGLFDYENCRRAYSNFKDSPTNNPIDLKNLNKMSENVRKLNSFLYLNENWNYYGAMQFNKSLVSKCIELIRSSNLKYQPDIFPTGRESIQFEYEEEDGRYLEIEIYEDRFSYFYINSFGCESGKENESWENIIQLIEEFHDKSKVY